MCNIVVSVEMFEIQSLYLANISFMLAKYIFYNIAPVMEICQYRNNGDYFMQMNAISVEYGEKIFC